MLMGAVHVHIKPLEDGHIEQEEQPRTAQERRCIKANGTGIERKDIGKLHQRPAPFKEFLAYSRRGRCHKALEELLKAWCAPFLTLAIVSIIEVKGTL